MWGKDIRNIGKKNRGRKIGEGRGRKRRREEEEHTQRADASSLTAS